MNLSYNIDTNKLFTILSRPTEYNLVSEPLTLYITRHLYGVASPRVNDSSTENLIHLDQRDTNHFAMTYCVLWAEDEVGRREAGWVLDGV